MLLVDDLRALDAAIPLYMDRIDLLRAGPQRRFHLLAGLVESILNQHQIGRDSAEHTIRAHWPELVGPANASYSHAVRIEREKRLVVHVAHSVVRNELFMHRAEIVERIQKLPGCAAIKELNLRAG